VESNVKSQVTSRILDENTKFNHLVLTNIHRSWPLNTS